MEECKHGNMVGVKEKRLDKWLIVICLACICELLKD